MRVDRSSLWHHLLQPAHIKHDAIWSYGPIFANRSVIFYIYFFFSFKFNFILLLRYQCPYFHSVLFQSWNTVRSRGSHSHRLQTCYDIDIVLDICACPRHIHQSLQRKWNRLQNELENILKQITTPLPAWQTPSQKKNCCAAGKTIQRLLGQVQWFRLSEPRPKGIISVLFLFPVSPSFRLSYWPYN